MSEILHANIFFFITSVAVVAVTIMVIIVLWYVIAILREVRVITTRVRRASETLERDIDFLRGEVKSAGTRAAQFVQTVLSFATSLAGTRNKPSTTRKRQTKETRDDDLV